MRLVWLSSSICSVLCFEVILVMVMLVVISWWVSVVLCIISIGLVWLVVVSLVRLLKWCGLFVCCMMMWWMVYSGIGVYCYCFSCLGDFSR